MEFLELILQLVSAMALLPLIGKSSGGTSGSVAFAEYLEATHGNMIGLFHPGGFADDIGTTLIEIVNKMHGAGGNPYQGFTFTGPANPLNDTDIRFNSLDDIVEGLDPKTDWTSFVDTVSQKIATLTFLDPEDIANVFTETRESIQMTTEEAVAAALRAVDNVLVHASVSAYAKRADVARRASVNRFAANMSDINAVNSSAYMFGMAIIESQHMQNIAEFDANLSTEIYRTALSTAAQTYQANLAAKLQTVLTQKSNKDQIFMQSVQLLSQSLFSKAELDHAVTSLKAEINRLRIVAQQEHDLTSLDIESKAATWDLKTMLGAGQFLGTLGGGAVLPEGPTRTASAIGGALSGAASGAMATGGNPIGAGVGAALGIASALF